MNSPELSPAPRPQQAPKRPLRSASGAASDRTAPAPSPSSATRPARRAAALDVQLALLLAGARYWSGVAGQVELELDGWRRRAAMIGDPVLLHVAMGKLDEESFNAEAAAMLATRAPRRNRRAVVRAIVALEILYDYLDGLTELLPYGLPGDGERLFEAFREALDVTRSPAGHYFGAHAGAPDGGYLDALVVSVHTALTSLPANAELAELLLRVAQRGCEAQLLIHRAAPGTQAELERWAQLGCAGSELGWREYLAGSACAVLCAHALIAAAAVRSTTAAEGLALERAYLAIAALPTILDSVVDREHDARGAARGFVSLYPDRAVLDARLGALIDDAIAGAARTRPRAHHTMILVGVIAYYATAPGGECEDAARTLAMARSHVRPLIAPALIVLRAWRGAKRRRERAQDLRALGGEPRR